MKRLIAALAVLALTTLLVAPASADPYLSRYVICNGGGWVASGSNGHFGCIGQPVSWLVSYGSTFVHRIGFLHEWMWPPMGDAVGDEVSEIPNHFDLRQNYPNPFNPMTTIRFDLPDDRQVRVEVFAIDGRRVATLVDDALPAGYHEVIWNAGSEVASGVYFYSIQAGDFTETKKMLLLK